MDRNIITVEAAAAHNQTRAAQVRQALQHYMREDGGRLAPLVSGTLGGDLPVDLQRPDSWYERILKYVPIEAVSIYLALDKGVHSAVQDGSLRGALWLALALMFCLAFNIAYLVRIAGVRSRLQVGVSSLAMVAYVYVTGGVFQALNLAPPEAQLFVMVATGAVLTFVKPFPTTGVVQSGQT
jgi:hypothetical protein